MTIATIAEFARQLDVPQLAHLASAALCFYFGRKGLPAYRMMLWSVCAVMYTALGYAGFLWGSTELPTSYRVWGPEESVFRPVPGIVELRAVDHIVQYLLGAVFGTLTLACAWANGVFGRLAAAAAGRVHWLASWHQHEAPSGLPSHPAR